MPTLGFDERYGGGPAQNYERYFVPAIGAPLAADLVGRVRILSEHDVLDVACGTGVVTRLLAQRIGETGSATGLDLNPGMLAVAREVSPTNLQIIWKEGDAEHLPFADASFDAVFCQMGLQFVPDKAAALREMHRTLKPGGTLALNLPGPVPELMANMAEVLEDYVGPEAANFVNQVFSLCSETEIRKLLETVGFSALRLGGDVKRLSLPAPKEFFWGYVHGTPLAPALSKLGEATSRALEEEIEAKWSSFTTNGALELELRLVTATATKQ